MVDMVQIARDSKKRMVQIASDTTKRMVQIARDTKKTHGQKRMRQQACQYSK
jgi:hypothetical protein